MDCKRCSKTMKNSSSLKRHMYRCMANGKTVKSVDKKVTCPTCNKTLARKYSLDRHIARFHAAVQESIVKSKGRNFPFLKRICYKLLLLDDVTCISY